LSVAADIERVGRKLSKYRGKIDEARDAGLGMRDVAEVEGRIRKVWRLQRKARAVVKALPPMERRPEIARAYADVHRLGEAAVKSLLDFRAELLMSNVSASLRVEGSMPLVAPLGPAAQG
jgi:hypothetical protein